MPAYKHCITESGADRQRQFEEALLEMMLLKPYEQIAVKEICDRVELSRKSFYRYFGSKEACLWAMVDHAILDMTDIPVRGEQMEYMLEGYFVYWKQRRLLLDALIRNDMGNLLFERGMACAAQEFGIREHGRDDSSHCRTVFFVSGLVGVLLEWHKDGCCQSPAKLAATLSGLFSGYFQPVI